MFLPTPSTAERWLTDHSCEPASAGKFTARSQANFASHSRHNESGQVTNRLLQETSTLRRRKVPRFAMAMEKMEMTEEQVFEETQRVEQEETFLGKVSTDFL